MKKNVLIFPAGTEIAFEIFNALKYSKFVKLFGGTSADDHSEFVFENLIKGFPYVDEKGFLDYLNKAIDEYKIDCVYPAHDSVSVFLSDNAQFIHAQVIIADKETTNICRSKKKTYEYLAGEDFVPLFYNSIKDISSFPVFVKPDIGQGSNGARIVKSKDELIATIKLDPNLIICEYLSGPEYTVDCFTDKNGKLLVTHIRERQRIRSGISVRSQKIPTDPIVDKIAHVINSKFNFLGAWFFQLKKDFNGIYKLLEISPRIPGTMGLSRNLGINFPMLTLFTFWGYDVAITDNGYDILLDRAFYSAYKINLTFDNVYVDFDDSLIVDGKVNDDLIRFLYQCSNKNIHIHLLSKHSTDIFADLLKFKISKELFDSITVIPVDAEKHNYIKEKKAIFIDDSFSERKKVQDALGISVFDLDMVESLIDWRK